MAADVRRVKEIVLSAPEQPQPTARGAVLDRECGTDLKLRQRVEALLRANDQPDHVFDPRTDAQPECIHPDPRRGIETMLSDSEMLRSTGEILSRLSHTGMSVVASTQAVGWKDLHGAITEGRLDEFFDYSAPFHIVTFNLKGAPTVEWKRETRFSRFQAQPGELLITPEGAGHSIRQLRPNVAFHCCISPDRLQSLAEQEWNAHGSRVEIVEAYNRDVELWTLGQRLAARLRSPIPGSRLFAETLVTQIAIKLLWRYSSLPRPNPTGLEKLTDPRLCRVIDYLQSSFGQEISLDGLAEVAGLSPNYFLHAFKQSTGKTPHRYLTELRIARACELLQDPHRSIADISLSVGFSSQSHLTTVFRRFMKTTPAAYRQEVLGLNPDGAGPHGRNGGTDVSGCPESPRSRLRQSSVESS